MAVPIEWPVGQTFPSFDIPLATDSGPDDLTNATNITLSFFSGSKETAGTGTLTVRATYPAEILYKPSPADVAVPFAGGIVIKAFMPPSNTAADQAIWDGPQIVIYPA
jgi:hypothetical protein